MEGLLGGVRASQRCTVGSVFVSIGAALPAAGFEKNTIAQFLSTSESPPPISHPSSFCHFLALSFCSLTCFLKALWRMRMGVFQWHRLINAFYLPMAQTQRRHSAPQSGPVFCLPFGSGYLSECMFSLSITLGKKTLLGTSFSSSHTLPSHRILLFISMWPYRKRDKRPKAKLGQKPCWGRSADHPHF